MVLIDHEKCVGCGLCVEDCISRNLELREGKAFARKVCFRCGHCVAVCPMGAVSIPSYDMADVEEFDAETFCVKPENLLHAIKFRRSIRSYKPTRLSDEEWNMLLQAGRYTATAKNVQDCWFVLVQDGLTELKEKIWADIDAKEADPGPLAEVLKPYFSFNRRRKANPEDDFLFRNAPAVLFVTSEWPLNAGLAAQNIETMAAAMGLGVLYNGYLARLADANDKLKAWLGIEGKTIRACMLLGHPDRTYVRTAPRAEANVICK